MKKGFRYYAAAWALLLVLFNLFAFASPRFVGEYDKFGGAFWAGYVGITVAFVGQLVCAYFALKAENAQKLFYRLPLVTVSYTGLVLTLVCGGLCMAVPDLPNWVGALVCLLILVFCALALIKAAAAAELVALPQGRLFFTKRTILICIGEFLSADRAAFHSHDESSRNRSIYNLHNIGFS